MGKGWSVWPDLAKFCHFGIISKVLGNFLRVYLVFGKLFILLWQNYYAIGQFFIVVDSHILSNNLVIWSHWGWLRLSAAQYELDWTALERIPTTLSFFLSCQWWWSRPIKWSDYFSLLSKNTFFSSFWPKKFIFAIYLGRGNCIKHNSLPIVTIHPSSQCSMPKCFTSWFIK